MSDRDQAGPQSPVNAARYQGGCLCGGVHYTLAGAIGPVAFCHCSQCRRASGSAFAANATIQAADFSLSQGQALLREYQSSPGKFRVFCSGCGSPLYARRDDAPAMLRLRLGTLDNGGHVPPLQGHIWTGSKADWFCITDDLPRTEGTNPVGGFKPL